jgi:subtilase family serine protease
MDLGGNAYRVEFPVQNLDGVYQLVVRPTLTDLAGNMLDQDSDGVAGENLDDQYVYSLPVHKLGDNLLLPNSSAEIGAYSGVPTRTGRWSGDKVHNAWFYPPDVPANGNYATWFVYTTPDAPAAGSISSDLWYLIELQPYQSDIAAGQAVLWAAAVFNRYLDLAYTDTQCELEVSAYAGTPDTFPSQLGNSELASVKQVLLTDADEASWEQAAGWLVLPQGSQFAAVRLSGVENKVDDADTYEFYGLYVDFPQGVIIVPPDKPLIVDYAPREMVNDPLSYFDITFSEPIDAATFTGDDIALYTPDSQRVAIDDTPVHLGNNVWRVSFAPRLQEGTFEFSIGPHIADLDGHELDLDIDGLPGEDPDDVYAGTLQVDLVFDLAVTEITAPALTIADPAHVTIGFTVTNVGPKPTLHGAWTDVIVLSEDETIGWGDLELARVEHVGDLAPGASYSFSQLFDLPPGLTGRYHLYVQTDVEDVLADFETRENNLGEFAQFFDVMPIPYADLVIESVQTPTEAYSGESLEVTWTATNQGIGLTNRGSWRDSVYLYSDPAGEHYVTSWWQWHYGQVSVGSTYTHTREITLPDGLDGTYYLAVTTAHVDGPFEFAFSSNNQSPLIPLLVHLTPAPDLVVTDIAVPARVEEGGLIDVSWTVTNDGGDAAEGGWWDTVYLRKDNDAHAPLIRLDGYRFAGPLVAGGHYTRLEQVRLPGRLSGDYRIVVYTDSGGDVYEHDAEANNQSVDDVVLNVTVKPRPDLQVASLAAPPTVDPGGTLIVEYVVTNQGTAGTTTPQWTDRLYLSLDNELNADDVSLGTLANQSALAPGESYAAITVPLVVPKRFRGDAYVIVATDIYNGVDEWPNDDNNHAVTPIFVNLAPLADLVVSDVVAPGQAVEGAQIEVRYTVTNLGVGETDNDQWQDSIWLTRDKNRPHPGQGDRLLKTLAHQGSLVVGAGYDQAVTVQLPEDLASGTWYVTPWTDPYGVVLEDTLATNINPDDPHEIDNNNYKARAITIIALPIPEPDLVVESVEVVPHAYGGDLYEVTWTVKNVGLGVAEPGGGWADRILLSNVADEPTSHDHVYILDWQVVHTQPLGPGESYTESRTYQLSPSAEGSYVSVTTDASVTWALSPHWVVRETNEDNNRRVAASDVEPVPADLLVTDIAAQQVNYSGEQTTLTYTVTNAGQWPVWSGTKYWKDHIWISADLEFDDNRATYLGTILHSNEQPLGLGESYQVQFEATLPTGLSGNYYLYVHVDAHSADGYLPVLNALGTGWWLSDIAWDGWRNNRILAEKRFDRWACEDPTNNLTRVPLTVTYREADLVISDLVLPADTVAGAMVPIAYSVTNQGTRDTRQSGWKDSLFLSNDATLDPGDYYLGGANHAGVLAIGQTYTQTLDVRIPQGIGGDYYLLAFADTAAHAAVGGQGTIRSGLTGIYFEEPYRPGQWDNVDRMARVVARGKVPEFQDEGNNITALPLAIAAATPSDLQVTALSAPDRALRGQTIEVRFTVTNFGGDTISDQGKWSDLIYLSRDELLDVNADRYLGSSAHRGGLSAGASYDIVQTVKLPLDLSGPYYVMVVTDPTRYSVYGNVLESDEHNNDRPSAIPLIIELPPPTDLEVTNIVIPGPSRSGDPVEIQWTVANTSDESATGPWFDAVYLSADGAWDLSDRLLGRVEHSTALSAGETYTATLPTVVPAVAPGNYRIIVRTDILNQVYEDLGESDNRTASADAFAVTVDAIQLGVPLATTLSTGQERVFVLEVPDDKTLSVTLFGTGEQAANEVFLRWGAVPTGTTYDAAYQGALAPSQTAIVPSTEGGTYYVLVRGYYEPADNTPITVLARLLPLAITNMASDVGGDGKYVTTTITGARFHEDAVVKLARPGFAEYEPVTYRVISSTKIMATFDLTGAPHGLYDVRVTNPTGESAVVPYRYLVERAVEPEVTIGIGGPRAILAGEVGTYTVVLQNVGNLDAPYVYFDVGIPDLLSNADLYRFAYALVSSNVRGGAEEVLADVPWAELDPAVNTDGNLRTGGFVLNQDAGGYTQFSVNLATYPGMQALNDHNWERLRAELYATYPGLEATGALEGGPASLDNFVDGLYARYASEFPFPYSACEIAMTPYRLQLTAAATAMTRREFVDHVSQQALTLRDAILSDDDATPALLTIAADETSWVSLYLAALEESGLLEPEDDAPPIREQDQVISLLATLASGILIGPAGSGILAAGDLPQFFVQLRTWYGHERQLAEIEEWEPRGFCGAQPVPALSSFDEYDLGLSSPTHFETLRVYVPWVEWNQRGAGLPPEFQINGPFEPVDGNEFQPLNLSSYYDAEAGTSTLVSLTGPLTVDTGGFLPLGQALPYTIQFQNDPEAVTQPGEIRIVTELDEDLEPFSFRLGDIKIGNINVHVPSDRALFQGDFDFTHTKGFVLRISAGVDVATRQATWLIQAIDPETGELIQDPSIGLLPPNNATGTGAGFVSYTILPAAAVETGDVITAQARVLTNVAPPEDTFVLSQTVDAVAPATSLSVQRLAVGGDHYLVQWNAYDDVSGSGVKHVTLYVAEDGGDFKIWQRQVAAAASSDVFVGAAGCAYEFLALATDLAGNRERSASGTVAPDDGSQSQLGAPATVPNTTPPDFGVAPTPSPAPPTNSHFAQAEQGIPAPAATAHVSEFDEVLRPFVAHSFATGFQISHAEIGPMAIVEAPDGSILVSGGSSRSCLYRFDETGGQVGTPWAELDYPIFNMAFDAMGQLWATTGGGPLLQLDPMTGEILNQFGDGLTIALAIEPGTDVIFVSSNQGVEIFDPATHLFSHFSRDRNLRVGSLAFDTLGDLWATTWPDRKQLVRFNDRRRAEAMLTFDEAVDSIAFGLSGTDLEGLLLVSHNVGPVTSTGQAAGGSELTMVELATMRQVAVAKGGTRGDVVVTTSDGRILLSQSDQVDVLSLLTAPTVIATNPPHNAVVVLPLPHLSVVFDHDMFVGGPDQATSVLNRGNYYLVGAGIGGIPIKSATYQVDTRTVLLATPTLQPGHYELQISNIASTDGLTLPATYVAAFDAVSDFSALVDITFSLTRADRSEQSVSYDVVVTNVSDRDLLLPLVLMLDPADGCSGVPRGAAGQTPGGLWLIDLSQSLATGDVLTPGASTLGHTLTIDNPGNYSVDFTAGFSAQQGTNQAPVFDSQPLGSATAGQEYAYAAQAHDPDGLAVVYLLYRGPAGMTVDALSGAVSWLPTSLSPALNDVLLAAFDTRGAIGLQAFVITVDGGNRAPVMGSLPETLEGIEGQPVGFALGAVDPDGDPLAVTARNLPAGATFDPLTQIFRWTPDYTAAGTYENVTFTITDGINEVSTRIDMLIAQGGRAPYLATPAPRTLREGETLRFYLNGSDEDGDVVTYFSDTLPEGALIDPHSGLFQWTPAYHQAGDYHVPVSITDGLTKTTVIATFHVLNANGQPRFLSLDNWVAYEDEPIAFQALARDPDHPAYAPPQRAADGSLLWLDGIPAGLVYEVAGLPSGAIFDTDTTMFGWLPGYADAGEYAVVFTVTDDGDGTGVPLTASVTTHIIVRNNNRPPAIPELANITVQGGVAQLLPVTVSDPDGDALTLSAESALPGYPLPDFITFTDLGNGQGRFRFAPQPEERGDYSIVLTAVDDGGGGGWTQQRSASYTFVLSVETENVPPQLDYVGNVVALVDEPLALTVRARDLDAEDLTFELAGLPAAAALTPGTAYGTAILQWTPTAADAGSYTVALSVRDTGNGHPGWEAGDSEQFTLIVRSANAAPVLIVADQMVAEDETLTLTLAATDNDGDSLRYSAANLPFGATFDPQQGVLQWMPNLDQAGIYPNIVLGATDGHSTSTASITIHVTNTNRAPRFVATASQYVLEQQHLEFVVVAQDADHDALAYRTQDVLPSGARLDARSGRFTWTPTYDQAGDYPVTFVVADGGGLDDTMDVTLHVRNVNRAPVVAVDNHSVTLGATLEFAVHATDADAGSTLTYSATNLPEGAAIDPHTGRFLWTPGPGQAGEYGVALHVWDGEATTSTSIVLAAAIAPRRPQVWIELTPSFPAIPGQRVLVHASADSLAEIAQLTLRVDGVPVALDGLGRATVVAPGPGKLSIEATASDADGLVGIATAWLKVRDPLDKTPPRFLWRWPSPSCWRRR